jgi:hypothetical protein
MQKATRLGKPKTLSPEKKINKYSERKHCNDKRKTLKELSETNI